MKKWIAACLLGVMLIGLCGCKKDEPPILQEEDIRAICELATVKSYYNNVAKVTKKADNIFEVDREMWIEYEGEAVIGVDMSKIKISISGQKVKIIMPAAELLDIKPLENTLNKDSYVVSKDKGWIKNKITTEDQQEAVATGQEKMKKAVMENKGLFIQAEDKAKELIENYIKNFGEVTGVEYKIVWQSAT